MNRPAEKSKKYKYTLFLISLFTFHFSLFTICCFADEQTVISSKSLDYSKKTSLYTLKGSVKIRRDDAVLEADEVIYNDSTEDAVAVGSVVYNDADVAITAERAEMNLEKKTGKLYGAEILFREGNYRISGKEIEKRGETYYFSPEAAFTTCDGPSPSWCFRGRKVSVIQDKELKAKDVTFRIKNIPVLYTPYFRAPLLTERKTGFLMPDLGYSTAKGTFLQIPFYLVISESSDATVVMDEYSERGMGQGLEYRYVAPNIAGSWWVYHIRDSELNRDFVELKGFHNQRSAETIGGFLNVNYINEKDYYREFNPNLSIRSNRFLESAGEIALPFRNSRAYLLSQYWVDLKEPAPAPAQRLPELGYFLNPTKYGDFWFSASAAFSNYWSDGDVSGRRIDVYPRIFHTLGRDVVLTQSVGLRETAYSLRDDASDEDLSRESFEYNATAHMRLFRKYGSFTHIMEPSVGYSLVTNSENDLLIFDSAELFKKTSTVEVALLNRLRDRNGEIMVMRLSQGFDSYLGDTPFLPFKVEVGVKRPLSLKMEARYDVHKGDLQSINSEMSVKVADTRISAGQRYNGQEDISVYRAGIGFRPFKPLYLQGDVWYDEKEKQIRDVGVTLQYNHQCWSFFLAVRKVPGDFDITFRFELTGLSKSLNL
ncbi:MAG: LPS assembly protein LptD [Nitrospirota bacterium]